jgi:uncharacterized UBP type Zn finger protein
MTVSVSVSKPCNHTVQIKVRTVTRPPVGCEECLKLGAHWVELRECLSCGHIGCCDSSKYKHARQHFLATRHPIITSAVPGETWAYCYIDQRIL